MKGNPVIDPTRPTIVRRLVRDFVHDSLYNPVHGYFSAAAEILSLKHPIDFNKVKGQVDMERIVNDLYLQAGELQTWHTPAELYKVSLSACQFVIAVLMAPFFPFLLSK